MQTIALMRFFSHNALEHIPEASDALLEMNRVLKSGGIVGIRDCDLGGFLIAPDDGVLEHSFALYEAYWKNSGGHPKIARHLGILLPEAGFTLKLFEPYPSPAQDVVTLSYTLPNTCSVELTVYDLAGRRVATLVDAELTAGRHEAAWDCTDAPSGVYLYRLETAVGSMVRRLVITR